MTALLICCAVFAQAPVQLSIAPDQPVPHVYVDDPLIIEMKSEQDLEPSVTLVVEPDYGLGPTALNLGRVALRARGTLWRVVEGVPTERGRYIVRARIDAGGTVAETTSTFCRVDRPLETVALPVCMIVDAPERAAVSPRVLQAAKGASVRSVRLDAGAPDLAACVEELNRMEFRVSIAIDAQQADSAEALARDLGDRVVCWEVDPGGAPESLAAIAKALRRGGAKAPVALAVADAHAAAKALEAGMGQFISALVVRGEWPQRVEVAGIRAAAERAGYEGMTIHAALTGAAADDGAEGPHLLRAILTIQTFPSTRTELDYHWICAEEIGPGYVYLSALAHRLAGAAFMGELDVAADVRVLGFRAGPEWTLAFWSTGASKDIALKIEAAADLALFDARNNPRGVPAIQDDAVLLNAAPEPQFLTGKAGAVVRRIAETVAARKARAFVETEESTTQFPPDIIEAVTKFTSVGTSGYNRLDFFNLLKLFPRIEEIWHSGGVPRSVAAPALANVAWLARALCVLEQERGEPFVEPLQKTLGNCGQFQSLYLTSSAGTPDAHERPDWVMNEVGRLMAEAERLAAEGRGIEACGLATLAEWRARALEFAAKARPLSAPEPERKPAAAAPAPEKKEKPVETKPQKAAEEPKRGKTRKGRR